jgi:predicted glycogen debranching enzyme
LHPAGHLHLESFRLEGTVPVWTWAIGDTHLEKRIWMEQGENTTYIQYHLTGAREPVRLLLKAFVNHRDNHDVTRAQSWEPRVEAATGGLRVEAHEGATPLWLLAPGADVRPQREWYRDYALAEEAERGLESIEDHLLAGEIAARLTPGGTFTVVASTRRDAGVGKASALALASALARRRAHQRSVLDAWKRARPATARTAPPWLRQLVLAADAFIVERSTPADPNGRTVIAGYPWLDDRGRDTMMALPGLTIATGRPEVARAILSTFARHVDRGMIPNCFPDDSETAEYDSVDAALWLYQAVRAYHDHTQDDAFLAEVYPVLEDIGAWYESGTRYGIGIDPNDGLLRAGEPGVRLTWMDARNGYGLTPRLGKPVEVNALWYNALTSMVRFAKKLKRPSDSYEDQVSRMEFEFSRFWNPATGCLFDVLDGPDGHDPAVRPNQLLAVSLPESPLPTAQRRAVLDVCGRLLLTSHGLRSLAPTETAYRGRYRGSRAERDRAYHQGSVWTWLLPHFALAHERVHRDRHRALEFLEPLGSLIEAYGVGSLPELAEGDLPHAPRGCIAQAWSVAETLRAYHALSAERKRVRRRVGAPAALEPATV